MDKKVEKIIQLLEKEYPQVACPLDFKNPLELLVATILSAQSTDKKVNEITKDLFKKYRKSEDYLAVSEEQFRHDISHIGLFRAKARYIRGSAAMIIEKFNGEVPNNMDDLTKLPGVARKTASVVLYSAFGKNEGVPVDTHMIRLSHRLGLTKEEYQHKIEHDLMGILPKRLWGKFAHWIVNHGRKYCIAQKPKCEICPLIAICPKIIDR